MTKQRFDLIVIGGGAAGLMAAGTAAKAGAQVLLLEKNEKLGRKLRITGKGRCNLCNNCTADAVIAATPGNGRFLYSALNAFSPVDTMAFFENLGIPLKTERGNRVFPVSDDANHIAQGLATFCIQAGVQLLQQAAGALLLQNGMVQGVQVGETTYHAPAVLVATGGATYQATGSTGDGYRFAKAARHTIITPKPSLVALNSEDPHCAAMQGLALKNCGLKLYQGQKLVYQDFGELLFTHFGLSGPVVLSASAHMRSGKKQADIPYRVALDLKPALGFEQLDNRLLRDFAAFANRDFTNYLPKLLPAKLIPVFIQRVGIQAETKCNSITREQRHAIIEALKSFSILISGFRPLSEAIVTAGGVAVKEVDPRTMQSKLVQGLYFAGEVLDVDAYTGGFNLQIAFSTGYLAGKSAWCAKNAIQ